MTDIGMVVWNPGTETLRPTVADAAAATASSSSTASPLALWSSLAPMTRDRSPVALIPGYLKNDVVVLDDGLCSDARLLSTCVATFDRFASPACVELQISSDLVLWLYVLLSRLLWLFSHLLR